MIASFTGINQRADFKQIQNHQNQGTPEKKLSGTLGFVTIVAHEERKKIHMTIFRKLITRIFLIKQFREILGACKVECVFPMVVWPEFIGKRHPFHPISVYHFSNSSILILLTLLLGCISYLEYYNREFITAGDYRYKNSKGEQ